MGKTVKVGDHRVTVARIPKGDRYLEEGVLGRGGMGEVREVVDQRLRRSMAMKILADDQREDDDSLRRFIEEAQITGQLDHPNVVPLYELGQAKNGDLFFTMKRVEGETLADLLIRLDRYKLQADNLELILDILIKVCNALEFAHSRGVIHRDLKPSNVMIGKYGQVYVLDWGLARLKEGERLASDEGRVIGTPGFMSPEQALKLDHAVDERSDVYTLGGLIYCVLVDQMPHPGKTAEARCRHTRRKRVKPPEELRPGTVLPPELCRIAMKALEWDPEDRYQSVSELRKDIQRFQRGGGWLRTRNIPAGELIIRQNDDGSEAYIIVSGECEVTRTVAGEEQVLRKMGPGECFGEMALLTGGKRTANVRALTDVELKVLTKRSLERELERSQWLSAVVRVLAERFRELDAEHALCTQRSGAGFRPARGQDESV